MPRKRRHRPDPPKLYECDESLSSEFSFYLVNAPRGILARGQSSRGGTEEDYRPLCWFRLKCHCTRIGAGYIAAMLRQSLGALAILALAGCQALDAVGLGKSTPSGTGLALETPLLEPAAGPAAGPPLLQAGPADGQSWFSFVAGDDIEQACTDGVEPHYRFIFNANFDEQVRIYDMQAAVDESAVLIKIIRGRSHVEDASKLTSHLGGVRALNALGPYENEILRDSLMESGFLSDPITEGTVLQSDTFYWAVSGCEDGEFHFNAWVYPSDRWDETTFPEMLAQLDFTGIMYNKEREIDPAQQEARRTGDGTSTVFDLTVTDEGQLSSTCHIC